MFELFDSEGFMPHGHCYLWRPDILWLNVLSDIVIALSYFAIPILLIRLIRKRSDLVFNSLFLLFAAFIVACGTTHLIEVWTIWNPQYGLQGAVKAITAIVSLVTAFSLFMLFPKILKLPSFQQIDELNKQHYETKAQQIIRNNEERFRKVIEAAPNGLIMVDQEGKITLCNAEIETLFGYERADLIGKPVEVLVPVRFRGNHPANRKSFFEKPESRQMGAGRDLNGVHKDGHEFPVEIGLNPLETSEGIFVLASVVDISKRKAMENKIKGTAKALKLRNQEMEQFVYTVSHDLKSPLVSASGFLGLMKQDFQEKRYDDIPDSIARLDRANNRMNQLISDLLHLSRTGRTTLVPEKIDTVSLLNTVRENLSERISEQKLKIIVRSDLPHLVADKNSVYQVFENLLINALKYGATNADPIVEIGGEEKESESIVYFKDNGQGIDPKFHKKIFMLFQRLQNDNLGTGVGLTIVERIMQRHNGRVWVESSPGNGATFYLAFPKVFKASGELEYEFEEFG